jgi:O-methyltransferase involved in polyketide biosynthesis
MVAVCLAAGFKQEVPTVWLAEGLLNYLTQEQNEALLHTLHKVCLHPCFATTASTLCFSMAFAWYKALPSYSAALAAKEY